jgi:putative transposase
VQCRTLRAARRDQRSGSYDRKLQTTAGAVTLRVPKLRRQTFETAIIERYRRRESSVEEALIEMYLAGVSVRRVEDITEALWGTRVSPGTVSNLNKKIYGQIEAWRNQPIEGEQPYVYLHGIVLKRTWAGEVRNVSLLVAISVNAEGYRQILGIVEGAKEDKAGWSAFLNHLKGRGLRGVELIVSDACMGLVESAAEYFPEARWQRCMVHFYRNVFSHVPAGKLREVALMLKAIHAQEDLPAAQRKAADVVARLRNMRLGKAAELVETAVPETLAYYAFPGGALAPHPDQQSARAHHAGDSPSDARGRRIPRWQLGPQPGRCQAQAYRRHALVDQTVSEYGAAQAAQRHDRLTGAGHRPKVRKILDTTHFFDRLFYLSTGLGGYFLLE